MEKLKLNFEVLPTSSWNNNLRTTFSKKAWDFIRQDTYKRFEYKCAICGRKVKRLEAHERWSFDEEKRIQKLEDVIALCHMCHMVIHIGRTQVIGMEDLAIKHFEKINNCDYQGYIKALNEATVRCNELSKIDEWALDLTWLNRYVN